MKNKTLLIFAFTTILYNKTIKLNYHENTSSKKTRPETEHQALREPRERCSLQIRIYKGKEQSSHHQRQREFIRDDELVEITPLSIRMRKKPAAFKF